MKTLIIDNFDSFTYNLYQYVAELGGNPLVIKNNEITIQEILRLEPTHIIISPGPGHPANKQDFGISGEVIAQLHNAFPILGVCLGHQGIADRFGAKIVHAPEPFHGKTSQVTQSLPSQIFKGIPPEFTVMRYHSLIIDESTLTDTIKVTARTSDNLIMGIEHELYPLFGVQFHPESIGTPQGKKILQNFLTIRFKMRKEKSRRADIRKHTRVTSGFLGKTNLSPVLNELK